MITTLRLSTYIACIAILGASLHAAAGTTWDTAPRVSIPQGEHHIVRLTLERGFDNRPGELDLVLRGDQVVQLWFRPQPGLWTRFIDSEANATPAGIAGSIRLRRSRSLRHGEGRSTLIIQLDLRRSGDTCVGSVTFVPEDGAEWQSQVQGAVLPPVPVARDVGWSGFAGGNRSMLGSAGDAPLVETLDQARPLWRSECDVPVSYGNAPDPRYYDKTLAIGLGGGSSSPVVADGVVYQAWHRPSKQSPVKEDHGRIEKVGGVPGLREKAMADGGIEHEADELVDFFRPAADDVIVAIDAATGATLWQTVLPVHTLNHQTHKHRGRSGVPVIAGDLLIVPNLIGNIVALDRATGAVRWRRHRDPQDVAAALHAKRPPGAGSNMPSPLLVDGVLVWSYGSGYHSPTTLGIDARSGETLWTMKGAAHGASQWRVDGRQLVVAMVQRHADGNVYALECIDPRTGELVWSESDEVLAAGSGRFMQNARPLVVSGDRLFTWRTVGEDKESVHHPGVWRLTADGIEPVAVDDQPLKENECFFVAADAHRGFIIGHEELRMYDLETGKRLATLAEWPDHAPRSNPALTIVGDHLLLSPEGQHGKHGYYWIDTRGNALHIVGNFWRPPHPTTTAYAAQPLVFPVLNGVAFFRGAYGIYAYDLRDTP